MIQRTWLMACVLALALGVPMARAENECPFSNEQSCTQCECPSFIKAVLHWLHLDTLCAYEEEEDAPNVGQEEQSYDPDVVHPQARMRIQVMVAPCPWAQLGQFQMFHMIRAGQCQLPMRVTAPMVEHQQCCEHPRTGCCREVCETKCCCGDNCKCEEKCGCGKTCDKACADCAWCKKTKCAAGACSGTTCVTPSHPIMMSAPVGPCGGPVMMPLSGCPLPVPSLVPGQSMPFPGLPATPGMNMCPFSPLPPITPTLPMTPISPLSSGMPMPGMAPLMAPPPPGWPLPPMHREYQCVPQPCDVPFPVIICAPPHAETVKVSVKSGKVHLEMPGSDCLKVTSEDLDLKLADGREWSFSVTEDGKVAVECEGEKDECSFAAQADKMSIEKGKNKLVLEGAVSLKYHWKDGKTGGLIEAERVTFDVTSGAMQVEATACKQPKKTVTQPVAPIRFGPDDR